jgi:hypothetical protein
MSGISKLSEKQWTAIEKRIAPAGTESTRSVAKEFHITEGAIRRRMNTHTLPIKKLAIQLVAAENAIENLPIATQVKVRTMADTLKGISHNIAEAAEYGAMTASKLAKIANKQSEQIDGEASLDTNEGALKSVMAISAGANRAAEIGLNLLSANKGKNLELSNQINNTQAYTVPEYQQALREVLADI